MVITVFYVNKAVCFKRGRSISCICRLSDIGECCSKFPRPSNSKAVTLVMTVFYINKAVCFKRGRSISCICRRRDIGGCCSRSPRPSNSKAFTLVMRLFTLRICFFYVRSSYFMHLQADRYRGVLLKDLQTIQQQGVYVSNETVHV